MQYVPFGQTGLTVSRFGLGCMRFPNDRAEAVQMVRYAIDHGVNYVDTAYVYEGSEDILGEALQDGYRERTYLVSKSPIWNVSQHADFEPELDKSLKRLGTDYLDVYLLHNLYEDNLRKVRAYDGPGFLDEMVAKGKVRYKGFSMHNSYDAFTALVDDYDWDMAQVQLNILDSEMQVGLAGLIYGAQRGLAMAIMEPLRGGTIIQNAPPAVAALLAAYPQKRSLVEWCFRWLYDKPEATVILNGASSMEQLQDSLRIFEQTASGVMSEADQELIAHIQAAFATQAAVACTACGYCQPCPEDVAIPDIFAIYNNSTISKGAIISDRLYYQSHFVAHGQGVDRCTECGQCRDLCPQGLDVPVLLREAEAGLSGALPPRFDKDKAPGQPG